MTVKVKMYDVQTIEVTPEILADAFFQMDDEEQRQFFEACAKFWKDRDFDSQMHHVVHNGEMTWEAVEIMKAIGTNALGM